EVIYTYSGGNVVPPPANPTYGVQASPDGGDTVRVSAGTAVTVSFTLTSTGNAPARYVVTPGCGGLSANTCAATHDTVALAAGESRQVGVLLQAVTSVGAAGIVTLTARRVGDASVTDGGSRMVRVVAPGSLSAASPSRAVLERGECVVVGLGGGGASECGDLRLAHALPATRTLNQARAPVLLYNSQHAYPHTIHATLVTNAQGAAWDSVGAVVRRNGAVMATGRWPGWADTRPHRIALAFAETGVGPASGAAGVFDDTLVVRVKSGGAWSELAPVPVRRIVVDRRGSVFGSGWWLAGLEQLSLAGPTLLWVGGDGSARVYEQVAPGAYASAEPEGPDTIVARAVTLYDGSTAQGYVRKLPGKGEVAYTSTGRHLYTRNRLGHTTWFFWDNTGRMVQIALPTAVPRDTSRSYYFAYTGAGGTLSQVLAPHARTPGDRKTWIVSSGTWPAVRVEQIIDYPNAADSTTSITQFGYDALGRDTLVINPAGTPTRFVYSLNRLARGVTTAMSNGRNETVSVSMVPQETRGLPSGDGSAPAPNSTLNTTVDGPLPGSDDYVLYYGDAAGRLFQVNTPLGITRILREDPRFPALATSTAAPNGHRVTAGYDAHGHLASQTDWNPLGDGRNATTLYAWNDEWDEIASVTSPTGITQTFGYDARGLREWEQVGPDPARRVKYGYNALGQVRSVTTARAEGAGESPETVEYDPATGNLASTTTPLGVHAVTHADRIGRDTLVVSPTDSLRTGGGSVGQLLYAYSRTTYDLASRVRETTSWGDAQHYFTNMDGGWHDTRADTLHTRNRYDAAGRLYRVERWSAPDAAGVGVLATTYELDGFGRTTAEVAPVPSGRSALDFTERYFYDAAGRDTLMVTRRLQAPIRMRYDVMGNLLSRTMEGDTSVFRYHAVTGALTQADNEAAHVRRSYYPNGALATDTLHIATEAGQFDASKHRFAQAYTYDLEGRRTGHILPGGLRPSSTQDRFTYQYHPETGALARITEPTGGEFSFVYRADGLLDSLRLPGVPETYHYDADGQMTRRIRGYEGSTVLYDDSLRRDARGKAVYTRSLRDSTALSYDGLGQLAHSRTYDWRSRTSQIQEEEYTNDALGNRLLHRRNAWSLGGGDSPVLVDPTTYSYEPGSGRHLHSIYAGVGTDLVPYRPHDDVHNFWNDAGDLTTRIDTVTLTLGFGTDPHTEVPWDTSAHIPENTNPAVGVG
ncbi:MAG TPA: hypothetical protein VFJ16_07095, partial [Longimicrobium sp.]|nr:hypothetical protein [Longimicrobium sp.]